MDDILMETAWEYTDYSFPQAEQIAIPGSHAEYGAVKQVFTLIEVVDNDTGDRLSDTLVGFADWEHDDYDIVDGDLLYIDGQHDDHGAIQQVFRLSYVEGPNGTLYEH